MNYQDIIQSYEKKGHTVKNSMGEKNECRIFLMQDAEGDTYVLRIYDKIIDAYEGLADHTCPNLPKIIKTDSIDDACIVEEEYIDGITLWEMISGGTRMDEKRAADITEQVCNGLKYMHEVGFIHRDIKPENVMLTPEGRVCVIDLDASMRLNPLKGSDTTLLGTAMYAAPEQFGLTRSDQRTDIYAVGILLNELLTGVHPAVETYKDGFLGNVIATCINMNPSDRYQTVEELINALEYAAKENASPLNDAAEDPTDEPVKKKNNMTKVVAAVCVLVVLIGAFLMKGALTDDTPADVDPTGTADAETVFSPYDMAQKIFGYTSDSDADGHALARGTDYLQLYVGDSKGDGLLVNSYRGMQSPQLYTETNDLIDESFTVYADESIGRIVGWDDKFQGHILDSTGCKVGATGFVHAEKDGKHYALPVMVSGMPMSAYDKLPVLSDISDGYLYVAELEGGGAGEGIPYTYEKGKDVTLYLVSMPYFDLEPECDNPHVTISRCEDYNKWPWPVFEMTYNNPDGGVEEFTVKTQDNNIVFSFTEE